MNDDFRLRVSIFQHPKIKRLKMMLGAQGVLSYLNLLAFTAMNKTNGCLLEMDDLDIRMAADWDDERDFVAVLLKLRLMDKGSDGSLSIHDWEEHNPWVAGFEERSQKAKAAARKRWDKSGSRIGHAMDDGAQGVLPGIADPSAEDARGIDFYAPGNAPSPSPLPTPNPLPLPNPVPRPDQSTSYSVNLAHKTTHTKPDKAGRGQIPPHPGPLLGKEREIELSTGPSGKEREIEFSTGPSGKEREIKLPTDPLDKERVIELSTGNKPKRRSFVIPDLADVASYFETLGCKDQAERFYDHYAARGWLMSSRQQMVDWQAACRNWMRNIKLFVPQSSTIPVYPNGSVLQMAVQERVNHFERLRMGMAANQS